MIWFDIDLGLPCGYHDEFRKAPFGMFTTSPGWFITFPAAQVDSCRSKSCATSSAKWSVVRSAQWFRPRCGRRLRRVRFDHSVVLTKVDGSFLSSTDQTYPPVSSNVEMENHTFTGEFPIETSTSHCYVWLLILSWWIWFIFCLKVSVFSLDSGPACTSASDWKPAARDRRIFGSFCDACNCAVEERCRRHSLLGSGAFASSVFHGAWKPPVLLDWWLYGYIQYTIPFNNWWLYGYYMDMGYTIPFNTPVDWYKNMGYTLVCWG